MFIELLPEDKISLLVDLATLFALSDNAILWDGRQKDELTSNSDLNNISIQKKEIETKSIENIKKNITTQFDTIFGSLISHSTLYSTIEEQLIEELKSYPISKIDAPEIRVKAASSILKKTLSTKEEPTTSKIILFQLFLLALQSGNISSIRWALLEEIKHHYLVPDFIFTDLLDRAEKMNAEINETLSLILE